MKAAALLLFWPALGMAEIRFDDYRASQVALATSLAMDLASSRGLDERNPLLGRGPFGGRQVITAVAVTGAAQLAMEVAIRKVPGFRRVAKWINFSAAGLHAGAAAHNWGQR